MAEVRISDLPLASPIDLLSLVEVSEPTGTAPAYASKHVLISELLDDILAAGGITLGSTAVALGATVTTIAGLSLTSPTLTGTPLGPTAAPGTNSTQLATTAYADAAVAAIIAAADAMVFKGVIDCSANPNYPAANRGETYRVSVAGKIGGASGPNVEVGDLLICLTDGTVSGTHAAVGASWSIVQTNLDGAVIGPASAVDSRIAAFDGTTGKLLKDGGILTSAIIVSGGALGAPASGVATNMTGLPVSTGISGLAAGVATLLGTPSSANLLAALTTKTGTGNNVFADGPTLVTPNIGAATGASLALSGALRLTGLESSQFQMALGGQEWRLNMASGGVVYLNDFTNSKLPLLVYPNASASIQIAGSIIGILGTTAAFPGLGRGGTELLVRLADNSGYAPATAAILFQAAGENGNRMAIRSLTELTTIAAAATTDTAISIPAGAIVVAVSVRVTVAIPTATMFDYGISGATTRYGTGIAVAANTTGPGTLDALRYYAGFTAIRITPNATPATNVGRVRVTIHYIEVTPATS